MKINSSKVSFSSIVGIGQKVQKAQQQSGKQYLPLNRGVNAVTNIDLSEVIKLIDFNSKEAQVYAPNLGMESLRKHIVEEYFPNSAGLGYESMISLTPGGIASLDIVMQSLDVENIFFPFYYWGSYSKLATIRHKSFSFYEQLDELDMSKLNESSCIFICDPSNPTGIKLDDEHLKIMIKKIADTGAIVILDSPYRKLFYDDNFFEQVIHNNVIITESFSKWVGLSGLRLGFIFSTNKALNEEINIRLLYAYNSVSSVSQLIIDKLLSTPEGKVATSNFRNDTTKHIAKNIALLNEQNLLVEGVYKGAIPKGIFAVINKTEDSLFENRIGAVGLDKFVYSNKDHYAAYSRICVSIDHELFRQFIITIA